MSECDLVVDAHDLSGDDGLESHHVKAQLGELEGGHRTRGRGSARDRGDSTEHHVE